MTLTVPAAAARVGAPAGVRWRRHVLVAVMFAVIAAAYTWPLPAQLSTAIASDPWDPVLNATVLWWNAVTTPFSSPWWNAPQFFPAAGVSTFTENLAGISVIASPVYRLTGNILTAYNLALWLTWPASAFAVYLLVQRLARRTDAAIVAGLAYGFAPYRVAELAHVQVLSSYWLPVALLAAHAWLESRRWPWLLLFAAAWLLQATANGYYLLFGGVLFTGWLLWFGSRRERWRAAAGLALAWVAASLPLAPVLLTYQRVHAFFGMRREAYEALAFSATPASFAQASGRLVAWRGVLADGNDDLFPGLTVLLLVGVGVALAPWWTARPVTVTGTADRVRPMPSWFRPVLWMVLMVSATATVAIIVAGPWEVAPLGVAIKMRDLNRAIAGLALSSAGLVWTSARARAAVRRRDPLVFYLVATLAVAVLCCGPVLRVGEQPILSPAPYQWLLSLPGFTELRVPTRFWMLGILCLSTAAGLVFSRLSLPTPALRRVAATTLSLGILADGWMAAMPMAVAPQPWPVDDAALRVGSADPVLELPLGPDYDSAATYRTLFHHRRVINGVSGYDPAHYAPLLAGLNDRDPAMLAAVASLSAYDIVIDARTDPDGAWRQYAEQAPGATITERNERIAIVHVPRNPLTEAALGQAWPIRAVTAFRHPARVAWDDKPETEWGDNPQRPEQWMEIDLGEERTVAGVTQALGIYARDFPRQLLIEVSRDRVEWTTAWQGPAAAAAFLAAARAPRVADMRFAFAPHAARYVRLRPLSSHPNMWRVAELRVHGPTGP